MAYKYDPAPKPMPAEATHISPPCCVSTHRSRVVDPDGPPTFWDHREAVPGIPHMTSFTEGAWTPRPLAARVIASTHIYVLTPGRSAMLAGTTQTWIKRRIAVRQRLERICTSYLLFLMVVTTKHSIEEAARFSGLHPSLFSKLLKSHSRVAVTTLESLSKTQARKFAKALARRHGLPWKIVIIIDSTLQHRASLHPENAKTFNHGKGYVIGHQWTNIVLLLGDMLIPLRPIPFYSKRYCQTHGLAYHSEHARVVEYLCTLDLEDYIGAYDRREVLVLADSGYDDKKIEKAIAA